MAGTVAIGIQQFNEIRKKGYFYIDKTAFIREWWEKGDSVTLITRPRRFGKTLTMSMVEQFFSVKYAGQQNLFEGLAIWKTKAYREIQGTYPVISLSFANLKEPSYELTRQKVCDQLQQLYTEHACMLCIQLLKLITDFLSCQLVRWLFQIRKRKTDDRISTLNLPIRLCLPNCQTFKQILLTGIFN